jgi:arginine decarboxylase
MAGAGGEEVDVLEVVQVMAARGLQTPLLLRFPDIVAHRLRQLQVRFPLTM